MSVMNKPLVSIGLPVYNGERYIESALDSILEQSYSNIEIIVCDNASTDRTQDILKKYMSKDSRISYFRHDENYGAAKNYNSTFEKSNGKYFKWAAHDDSLDVDYISRCVCELENDADLVLVQPRTGQIDQFGEQTGHEYVHSADVIKSCSVGSKLYRTLTIDKGSWTRIFGVIRTDVLKDTPLIDNYIGSDLTLLGELGLRGKVRDIDDVLFWRRDHNNTSTTGQFTSRRKRWVWFDTSHNPRISLPEWRLNLEMYKSIFRQNISSGTKARCCSVLAQRMWKKKRLLVKDLYFALVDFTALYKKKTKEI